MNAENQEIHRLLLKELKENVQERGLEMPRILYNNAGDDDIQQLYDECRRSFNRRFDYFPKFIVLCQGPMRQTDHAHEDSIQQQVSSVITVINQYNEAHLNASSSARLPLSLAVSSGGHDHEGESSGNNLIQINFSHAQELKHQQTGDDYFVEVQPGVGFEKLLTELDKQEIRLGIPHGTCATVHVPGFIMGGGWGPWTRKYGMACEYLVEVDLVLGDGSTITARVSDDAAEKELLWALRGGGGLSYGIATRFKIKAFKLPNSEGKFTLNWNCNGAGNTQTIKILNAWEKAINGSDNPSLIGTNLQIMAKPGQPDANITDAVHQCSMYGYFEGDEAQALQAIETMFADVPWEGHAEGCIHWQDRLDDDGNTRPMDFSDWDRVSASSVQQKQQALEDMMPGDIPPEHDEAAPHKISSRLTGEHWDEAGRKNLLRSLCSPRLHNEGISAGVSAYVTLGAISGPYYTQSRIGEDELGVSFPYRHRLYTIQYQTWWNQQGIDLEAQRYANRAMDWIAEARNMHFPQTHGSFISFKDAAIPTDQYFLHNYPRLTSIKKKHSQDKNNLLRSRKTIV